MYTKLNKDKAIEDYITKKIESLNNNSYQLRSIVIKLIDVCGWEQHSMLRHIIEDMYACGEELNKERVLFNMRGQA